MTPDPHCWACCIHPVEGESMASFRARLVANHQWLKGEHNDGGGQVRLRYSLPERPSGGFTVQVRRAS